MPYQPSDEIRDWDRYGSAVFYGTRDEYGILSNMARTPMVIGGIYVASAEHLYQALRFVCPRIQAGVLDQYSPMAAKIRAHSSIEHTIGEWDSIKFEVMQWCIRAKALLHPEVRAVYAATAGRDIVEFSKRDRVWGATPRGSVLRGRNALGQIHMRVRNEIGEMMHLPAPEVARVSLLGQCIRGIQVERVGEQP